MRKKSESKQAPGIEWSWILPAAKVLERGLDYAPGYAHHAMLVARVSFVRALREDAPEVLAALQSDVLPVYMAVRSARGAPHRALGDWRILKRSAPQSARLSALQAVLADWASRFGIEADWMYETALETLAQLASDPAHPSWRVPGMYADLPPAEPSISGAAPPSIPERQVAVLHNRLRQFLRWNVQGRTKEQIADEFGIGKRGARYTAAERHQSAEPTIKVGLADVSHLLGIPVRRGRSGRRSRTNPPTGGK